MKTDVTDSVKFVHVSVMDAVRITMGSAKAIQTNAKDTVKLERIVVMDSTFIRGERSMQMSGGGARDGECK